MMCFIIHAAFIQYEPTVWLKHFLHSHFFGLSEFLLGINRLKMTVESPTQYRLMNSLDSMDLFVLTDNCDKNC